ncbi:T9SS type A sorting domain-containing protein [Flavobacterium sp. J372]|uniref:T9SS type A sorting domain-containing protein n=1 Tax=Flavobacterium sp. J372 TaxID=2898436 RepID=UPI00215181C3|nr:T9SS type A sorting domain-containing protein [Flavobacterium sp. J372]MCR5860903.1 T9SS type A sorting domain-containing protein [Flavobacterium sp. J372]
MVKKYFVQLLFLFITALCYAQAPQVLWDKYFGGQGGEAISIEKTADGGFIIAGTAQNAHEDAVNFVNGPDVFVVKVNANFDKEWSYCYGGQYYESPSKIIQTSDGGYAFAATKSIAGASFNVWVVKLNTAGQVSWEYNFGGSNEDWASDIVETASGDLVVSGWSRSSNGDVLLNKGLGDYWILRLNQNGIKQQSFTYGGTDDDNATSLVVNPDGTMIVAGETFSENNNVTCRNPSTCESDFWLIKLSETGIILWAKCFGSVYSGTNFFNRPEAIIRTNDNGYMIVGYGRDNSVQNSFGGFDFWAIKIDDNGNLQWKKNYGGQGDDRAYSVRQTIDGGYVIAGSSWSNDGQVLVDFASTYLSSLQNGWVIKVDGNGNLEWQKAIGGDFSVDYLNDLVEISDGEFAAIGRPGLESNNHTANSAGRRFWIVRLSQNAMSTNTPGLKSLSVYPVPVGNTLHIDSGQEVKKVSVCDISGRNIFTVSAQNITEISTVNLMPGIYNVIIDTDTGAAVKKITKGL